MKLLNIIYDLLLKIIYHLLFNIIYHLLLNIIYYLLLKLLSAISGNFGMSKKGIELTIELPGLRWPRVHSCNVCTAMSMTFHLSLLLLLLLLLLSFCFLMVVNQR